MKFLNSITLVVLMVVGVQQVQASHYLPNLSTILKNASSISELGPVNFFVALGAGACAYSTLPKSWREKIHNNIPTQTLRDITDSRVAVLIRKSSRYIAGSAVGAYLLYNNYINNCQITKFV